MITPKLTAALVAMTALVGVAPGAVFAQDMIAEEDGTSDTDTAFNEFLVSNTVANVADTSADGNLQVNSATVSQSQSVEAECEDDCSAEADAEDLTQISNIEQENSIETGDVEQTNEDIEQENSLEEILAIALADLDLS
jgi:hypothetical protein